MLINFIEWSSLILHVQDFITNVLLIIKKKKYMIHTPSNIKTINRQYSYWTIKNVIHIYICIYNFFIKLSNYKRSSQDLQIKLFKPKIQTLICSVSVSWVVLCSVAYFNFLGVSNIHNYQETLLSKLYLYFSRKVYQNLISYF